MYNTLFRGKFKALLKIYHGVFSRNDQQLLPVSYSRKINTLYMFGSTLRTPLPIVMISSDIKTSSQHTPIGLNLVFGIILIFCLVHFILIQIHLPQEEVPEILIIQLPNGRITQNIIDGNKSC